MKAKIDTLVTIAWNAFENFINDIYGEDYLETASDEQVNWEWEEFKRNLSTKNQASAFFFVVNYQGYDTFSNADTEMC